MADDPRVEWTDSPEDRPDRARQRSQRPDDDQQPSIGNYLAAGAIVVLGPVVLVALIAVIGALGGSGDDHRSTPTTFARSTTTGTPLPAPDPETVATATTITFGPDSRESVAAETERLLVTWANQLDNLDTGIRADQAQWCSMADLTPDELGIVLLAGAGRETVDYVDKIEGLGAEEQARIMDAMATVLADRLDRYC